MKKNAPAADPELLLGFDTSDDAAVYRIVRNAGVQADDVLFYTKKIGSGIMNSAYRAGFETPESMRGVPASALAKGGVPGIAGRVGNIGVLTQELGCGEPTLRDIVAELEKPGRDPRDDAPEVVSVEDNVTVWVTGIDKTRGKISLSMVEGK